MILRRQAIHNYGAKIGKIWKIADSLNFAPIGVKFQSAPQLRKNLNFIIKEDLRKVFIYFSLKIYVKKHLRYYFLPLKKRAFL